MDVIAVVVVFLTIVAIIVAPIAKTAAAFVGLLILNMLSENYSLVLQSTLTGMFSSSCSAHG